MEHIYTIHQTGNVFFLVSISMFKNQPCLLKVRLTTDVDTTQRG